DALPQIGHACGHNAIATAGVGAGAGLAAVRDKLPKGRLHVIGTPAEEGGGGKVKLIQAGVFRDVDAAMMCHGFDQWAGHMDLLGIVRVGFEFAGKAAHAAADPWEGVNALDAAIQTYNNVSMLRQQVRPDSRIHGIITHGGAAPNIIPEFAAATFYVRALNLDYMWEIHKRVIACAEGAAKSTGCGLKVIRSDDTVYETMKRNETLLGAFRANMKALGIAEGPPLGDRLGPSDVGNVSHRIHDTPELCFKEEKAHGWLTEFLEKHGAQVERGVGGLPTAFRATIRGTGPGPTIAIMAEYDALPGIGHACGHNVIATAGAGAGAALAQALGRLPFAGRIQVIGTPAEEGGAGKVRLMEAGVFEGVDAAMMIHGRGGTQVWRPSLGIIKVKAEFHGKATHASSWPWRGVNALNAV